MIEHTTEECTCNGKRCPKCDNVRCIGKFNRNKASKDGLQHTCKICRAEYRSRPENKARRQEYLKNYDSRPEVQEHKQAYGKEYRSKNHDQLVEKKKAYYLENREQKLAHDKEYRSRPEVKVRRSINDKNYRSQPENKERRRNHARIRYNSESEYRKQVLAYQKEYRSQPKAKQHRKNYYKVYRSRTDIQAQERSYRKEYYQRSDVRKRGYVHYHTRRARKRSIKGTYTPAQIQEQLKRQQYCCYYAACGHSKFQKIKGRYIYHIEHTYPLSRVIGSDIPANDMGYLVLACPSCNSSKGDKFPWEWPEGGRLL